MLRPTFWIATRVLAAANLALGIGDIGSIVADQISSSKAERWTETLVKPTLQLDPTSVTIGRGGKVRFKATVAGATGQTLLYIWETSSLSTTLTDNAGKTGTQIDTNSNTVDLVTQQTTIGIITVTVNAYVIGLNGNTLAGTGKATITVDDKKQVVAGRFFIDEATGGINEPGHTGVAAAIGVPKVANAKTYQVHCYGFKDNDGPYGTEINVGWTLPNLAAGFTDRGSEYVWGIAGSANVAPENLAQWEAYYSGQFQGMIVEVTVSF